MLTRHMVVFVMTIALTGGGPQPAFAEWCDPPIPPTPTAPDVAREYQEEFKAEFDQYFRDASRYTTCLANEQQRIFEEMRAMVSRYERFLKDSREWEAAE